MFSLRPLIHTYSDWIPLNCTYDYFWYWTFSYVICHKRFDPPRQLCQGIILTALQSGLHTTSELDPCALEAARQAFILQRIVSQLLAVLLRSQLVRSLAAVIVGNRMLILSSEVAFDDDWWNSIQSYHPDVALLTSSLQSQLGVVAVQAALWWLIS